MTTTHSSWGAPCKGTIKTLVRSDGLKLPLRLELLELVALLIDETERRGYDVKPGQTWGYACRRIAGSSSWSNHAWGLAVDINAPSNPMTNRLVTDMPSWMPALWKSYGFRWGGDYSGRKDAMHYEFLGSVADARLTTERARVELGKREVKVYRVIKTTKTNGAAADGRYLTDGEIVLWISTGAKLADREKRYGPAALMPRAQFDDLQKVGAGGWPE